jgi:P27 family predicted phage terminase small subunit
MGSRHWGLTTQDRRGPRTRTKTYQEHRMTPPKHLSAESKRNWRRIAAEYELTPDAELLLKCAFENYDRAQEARELVTREGLVIEGKRHPGVDIEKQAYGLFQRFMRQLGLDVEDPKPIGRPNSSV